MIFFDEFATMSSSFVAVNVPGGFGTPSGGGGKDPRKPGSSKPGRDHEDKSISKQLRKQMKKERKKRSLALVKTSQESDVEMMPPPSQSRLFRVETAHIRCEDTTATTGP